MGKYANPAHEQRVRQLFAEAYPECSLSISSDVLREYREYERSVTTLVDAFVKPTIANYVRTLADRLAERTGRGGPVLRDEVERRRHVGRRGGGQAHHHRAVEAGGRRWGPRP